MENEVDYYVQIKDELFNADDEEIISRFLKRMIVNGDSWPEHFISDVDVFNKNPNEEFYSQSPKFLIVRPRTESCGKTDSCESGCWRVIGRDKLIKSEQTGKFLGFKRILKFCSKRKPREYKRIWVMEEYRLVNSRRKQDQVICKIRFLFEAEVSYLLSKHFSYLSTTSPLPPVQLLPAYGACLFDKEAEGLYYLQTIVDYDENTTWPRYVTNDVYRLHPLTLVDPQDDKFKEFGTCVFANRTNTCGKTGDCDGGGYWEIVQSHRGIRSKTGEILGYRRVFELVEEDEDEEEEPGNVCQGEDVKESWLIDEYRLDDKEKQNKVLCLIRKFSASSYY
ncbi:hypothetical protein CARUB_v10021319mg [Capsella rubella]|uniref:NAC domain-containing protein n=1 Tax=Capsella rubella TaxID=81985 RepID=R0GDW5_9BRAS|nr:uncharacterized protein LOC17894868 [Capsella rubella]EOA33826.1 hypothetical protein CARUB_v10021319mg [Capsella rubella]